MKEDNEGLKKQNEDLKDKNSQLMDLLDDEEQNAKEKDQLYEAINN